MAKKEWLSKRNILWFLVFFGFAINYMIRVNLNIAIVSMVRRRQKNDSSVAECFQENSVLNNETDVDVGLVFPTMDESRYAWDENQQAHILGGFFWLHWVTQVPGGILAKKYGTKLVFGLSNFISCSMAMLIPACAGLGYQAIVILRVIQGLIVGLAWPSMHHMAAKWTPPNERSRFVSAYLGSSVGAAVTFPMCGYLIEWFDWPSVFYATGIIGAIWFSAWWFFVYDSPANHPSITEKERTYIEKSIGGNITERKLKTPWTKILLSIPLWMNILAQWSGIWGLFTLLTQAPTYFINIHGMSVRKTGILTGLPHVCRVSFAVLFSSFGDYLLRKNIMSRTWVRKFATTICTIVHGLFILGLAFSGCNSIVAMTCLMFAVGSSGAVSTGPLANIVDISPNFAGISLGICNMITVAPGFISPIVVGYLTYQNQTTAQWQKVYMISAIMMMIPGILYLIFASSDIQSWNDPHSVQDYKMKALQGKKIDLHGEEERVHLNNETERPQENAKSNENNSHLLTSSSK